VIEPAQKDDALLADIEAARDSNSDALHLWWLGQSGFLAQWRDRRLLFDPYLSDSLTRKYADTDKPHVRMTERAVAPERLRGIDVATSTHNHTDHLDAETLKPLFAANPGLALVLPEANREFAAGRLDMPADAFIGFAEGETKEVAGIRFTAVPAAHEERTPAFLGFVAALGPWSLYHSGDTLPFPGLEDALKPHRIDVALLPINGREPERRVAGNLDGPQAAALAKAVGAGLAVPCHFEMFEFNTASPEPFRAACRQLGQPCHILQAGERLTLPQPDRAQ